ncbi:MAG: hypothetical protein KGM42_11295 [Hyphomicrobiales bacterium]|nr:hypothetical protein [Hyphomicrobiales bacterium]
MHFVALFFAGAFLCNSIPHLAKGLQGEPFPTPFATPRGVGNSPPLVNFLWGAFNVCIGLALLARHPVEIGANADSLVALAGALAIGVYLAVHFGKARGG